MDTAHWINGKSVDPLTHSWLALTSPTDGSQIGRVAMGNAELVAEAVTSAHAAYRDWAARPPAERSTILHDIARALRSESEQLVEIECAQTGKLLVAARYEIGLSIDYFDFYAGLIRGLSGSHIDVGPKQHITTRHAPYGVVGVITTWNGPMAQITRNAAPALAAGNAVVAKPSEFTPTTTVEVARIATEAGLPAGLLNVVNGTASPVGEAIVNNDLVRKIHFTGSVVAGRRIGEAAARRIVPVTMELGGKSPNVIFADADLDKAALGAVAAFTANAGQICSAGTRLIVQREVHEELVDRVRRRIEAIDVDAEMGPITTATQYEKVGEYLSVADQEGLMTVTGGRADYDRRAGGERSRVLQPTVYDHVGRDSRLAREEIFGPVLTVSEFTDEDEAVELANDSEFGLAAGVWTKDVARALRVAARIEAGQVFVNQWSSPIEAPFGGFKGSGFGREKGVDALREYTQLQTLVVNLAD